MAKKKRKYTAEEKDRIVKSTLIDVYPLPGETIPPEVQKRIDQNRRKAV